MAETIIRSLLGEEFLDVLFNFQMYAFRASPPFPDKEEWAKVVRERKGVTYHTLFEDGKPVSGAASTAMTQNIRGKLFPAGGVWGVVTLPGARRKGYCRQVMTSLLLAEKDSGKVFSNLYPFRESFYQRLGYVTFPLPAVARLSPISLSPLLGKDFGGDVEVKLSGEGYDELRDYLASMRPDVHGMGLFDIGDRVAAEMNRFWVAFARVDGKVDGIMLYNLQGEEVTKFKFTAYRFYFKTSRGKYLLLDWIARHIDQADRVEIWLMPSDHPEAWLDDIQVKIESQVRAPMGRILDVEKIGGMQVGTGSFSAHISDPICASNTGTWKFEAVDNCLKVTQAQSADCELSIQGLSALVLGAHDPVDFVWRGWGNPSPDVQSLMRSMFPAMLPFLHENF